MALQLEDPSIRPRARIHNLSLPSPAPRTSSLVNSSIHVDFPSCPSEPAQMAGAHIPPSEKPPAHYAIPSAGYVAPKRKPASHMAPIHYTCRLCHKSFPTSRALNGHTRIHGGHGSSDPSYHPDGSGYTSHGHGKVVEELKKPKHSLLQNPNSLQELLDQGLHTQGRCCYNRWRLCCQKESSSRKTCVAEEEEKFQAEQEGAGEDFPEAEEGTEGHGGEGADAGNAQYFDQHDNGNAKGENPEHEFGGEDDAEANDAKTLTRKEKGHIKIRLKIRAHTPSSLEEDSRSQKKAKLMDQTLNRRALPCALQHDPKQSQARIDTDFEHVERKGSQNALKGDQERYGNTSLDVIEAALALYMIATATYPAPLPSSSKVRLKLKGVELHEQTKEETIAHPCKLCDKVFSSPQALGGHISARHKKASLICKPKEKRISSYIERPQHDEGAEEHTCTTCNVSFRSGQALGGHKRAHWSGLDKATNDYEQVQLPHQDEQTKIATKSMNVRLDLDLPAPLEDEGEYGYGHEPSFAEPMELEERHDYGYDDHIGSSSLSLEKLTTKQTTSDYTQSTANYAIDDIGLDSSKITRNAIEDSGLKCTSTASRGADRRQVNLLKLQAQKPIVLAH